MNFLSFLAVADGLPLHIGAGQPIMVSPIMTGVLTSAFWTSLAVWIRNTLPPERPYSILTIYAVMATLLNMYLIRNHDVRLSVPVLYATGLFAGNALALHIASPVLRALDRPHAVLQPAGGTIAVGIPLLLLPFPWFSSWPPCALFLLVSSALGLWTFLFLINVGFSAIMTTRREPMLLFGITFVVPEYLGLAFLPTLLRQIAVMSPTP